MLEILRAATQPMNDYATGDPIFSNHGKLYIMPYIRCDMLMLENLPLLVLKKLVAVENQKVEENGDEIVRSATELYEAGIRFKKSKTRSLQDISFKGGILRLPPNMADNTTESMFLNQIAFERFHDGAGNEFDWTGFKRFSWEL
ncbi:hypothetical protein LguiA_020640 [Lonicera macranthoides]